MIAEISVVCVTLLAGLWMALRFFERTSGKATAAHAARLERLEQIVASELSR